MTATDTVQMKTARISPLMALNPADGLSASRRAARSAAGRLARWDSSAEAAIVSHGPARIRPATVRAPPPM